MKLAEVLESGELERYEPGHRAPGLLAAADVDAEVAAAQKCGNCGHQGLDYRPFTKPGSYRAFAVCPRCDEAEEF
jgi:hypothetical protein